MLKYKNAVSINIKGFVPGPHWRHNPQTSTIVQQEVKIGIRQVSVLLSWLYLPAEADQDRNILWSRILLGHKNV